MKDKNKDCPNHDMVIIESNDYGYFSKCEYCGKTYEYNSNDSSRIIPIALLIGIIGGLLFALVEWIF